MGYVSVLIFALQLTGVERYAMNVLERADEGIAHEQLRLEQQLEQQKREWELDRQRAVRNNQEMMNQTNRDNEEEPLSVSANQVNINATSDDWDSTEDSTSSNTGDDSSSGGSSAEDTEDENAADNVESQNGTDDEGTHNGEATSSPRKRSKSGSLVDLNQSEESPRTRSRGQVNIDLWTLDEREKSIGRESTGDKTPSRLSGDQTNTESCNDLENDVSQSHDAQHDSMDSPLISQDGSMNDLTDSHDAEEQDQYNSDEDAVDSQVVTKVHATEDDDIESLPQIPEDNNDIATNECVDPEPLTMEGVEVDDCDSTEPRLQLSTDTDILSDCEAGEFPDLAEHNANSNGSALTNGGATLVCNDTLNQTNVSSKLSKNNDVLRNIDDGVYEKKLDDEGTICLPNGDDTVVH